MEKFVSVSEESVTDRCSMKFLKEIDRGRLHFKTAWETRLGQWLLLCAMLLCAIWAMGCGLWAMGYGLWACERHTPNVIKLASICCCANASIHQT